MRRPGKPRVIRTDIAVLYVGDEAEKQALLLGEPERFFTTPAYDGTPQVMLRLGEVDLDRVEELITDEVPPVSRPPGVRWVSRSVVRCGVVP
ncbi:hypothetical protein, partial [Actinomadura napierensis]|uniref:hypothetical protein n=1 Tax=Actinomadura napierensis TaxID=267854 RepID=UPI00387E3427